MHLFRSWNACEPYILVSEYPYCDTLTFFSSRMNKPKTVSPTLTRSEGEVGRKKKRMKQENRKRNRTGEAVVRENHASLNAKVICLTPINPFLWRTALELISEWAQVSPYCSDRHFARLPNCLIRE